MQCPKCEVGLEPRLAGPVGVDECPQCRGAWYEDDEVRQAKDAWDADLNWMDFDLWKDRDSMQFEPTELACPACDQRLVAVHYGDTGIEADCCPSCRGVWLDEGEFAGIIDSLTAEMLAKPVSDYLKESLEEAREIISGTESLVSEWKDLKTVVRFMTYRLLTENPRIAAAITAVQTANPF